MARCSRILIDNASYHITARGNQQQHIFLCAEDYEKYLSMVKKAKRKYRIFLYAYCLMKNHVHMLIEAIKSKDISKFMHWVNRGYTAYFNAKYGKTGHLWQGRFQSSPIVKGQYLINAATYIENNPVQAGIVNDPADYPWSSYRARCLLANNNIVDEMKIDCRYMS